MIGADGVGAEALLRRFEPVVRRPHGEFASLRYVHQPMGRREYRAGLLLLTAGDTGVQTLADALMSRQGPRRAATGASQHEDGWGR